MKSEEIGSGKRRKDRPAGKRRRKQIVAFEMVRLNRNASEPLHQQLYRQIGAELRTGSFAGKFARLPSTRELASELGVSRLTVRLAFAKLHSEGYIYTRVGSGTFAAESPPEAFLSAQRSGQTAVVARPARIARRVADIRDRRDRAQFGVGIAGPPGVSFVPGQPAVDEFPIDIWEKLRAQVLRRKGAHLLRYASSHGDADLRKAIAAYLCDFRGARCIPEQVVVTSGTQQAILMSALTLLNPSESAWVEDPAYQEVRKCLTLAGAKVIPKALDNEGIVVNGRAGKSGPRLIYVTPSHQFPLGITMSAARRKALLDFAQKSEAYIFEDDYCSEFRFVGSPLPCLQGIDPSRVIYAGTMSKILHPALRLGYLVVPEPLLDAMIKVRAVMDQHSSPIEQAILARFLSEGFFLSHVKRIRRLYAQRRVAFIEEFHRSLGKYARLQVQEAGLHFVAWLRGSVDLNAIFRAGSEVGITPIPLSFFCLKAELAPALVFGFAAWTTTQIRKGLAELGQAMEAGQHGPSRGRGAFPF